MKYSVPGGHCFKKDWLVAIDRRMGTPPVNGTNGPVANWSVVVHLMYSHKASLFLEPLKYRVPRVSLRACWPNQRGPRYDHELLVNLGLGQSHL